MALLYTPPPSPSPVLQCVLEYFEALRAWDLDRIMACFSDDLEHQILPKSLGQPLRNKTQYAEYFKGVMPMFARFQVGNPCVLREYHEEEYIISLYSTK